MPVSTKPAERVERMLRLSMKPAQIAPLAGISAPTLSRWINGAIDLSYVDVHKIDGVLSDCEMLQARSGVPINWTNAGRVKELLGTLARERKNPPIITAEDCELLELVCEHQNQPHIAAQKLGMSIDQLAFAAACASAKFSHWSRKTQYHDGILEGMLEARKQKM